MKEKKITGLPERRKALADFFAAWEPQDMEEYIPLDEAIGRVTTKDLFSVNTLPVFRSSAMDGIAVQSAQFAEGMPDYTKWVLGVDYARADTGDDFDDRFDAVIAIENVTLDGEKVTYIEPDVKVHAGSSVNPKGSSLKEGDLLLGKNMPIRPTDLAALAMGGAMMVPVWKQPKVAFIPTGTELVPPNMRPERGQNVDTNSIMVRETLKELGAEPVIFPIIPDEPKSLENAMDMALKDCDMVIINAGTAKGEDDWNARMMEERGTLIHHYIAAVPGRPMALAVIEGKPVINMPGPTMASFFGCEWCINACVARFLHTPVRMRETVRATVMEDIHAPRPMALLIRMDVFETEQGYICYSKPFRKNSLPASMTSNAMYISEIGEDFIPKGTELEVTLLRGREFIEKR